VGKAVKFSNREDAAHALGHVLSSYRGRDAVVIGLVRGGAVVARVIANDLDLPFDILVVKKIPSPQDPELAIGAIASDEITYINKTIAHQLDVSDVYIYEEVQRLSKSIERKNDLYRKNNTPKNIDGKTVILVDDGIATGATMKAAIAWSKAKGAKEIIVAAPVASADTVSEFKADVDHVVVVEKPASFHAVGQFYETFEQIEDKEVIELLQGRD
jgi:predicted phosphoribosyltransferase